MIEERAIEVEWEGGGVSVRRNNKKGMRGRRDGGGKCKEKTVLCLS